MRRQRTSHFCIVNIASISIMTAPSADADFLTAIGIIPLTIGEYRTIDELCVYLEPKFRTSPLDVSIDDVDYKRQLESRVNNLSHKSDRPTLTLANGANEWRVWILLKSKGRKQAAAADADASPSINEQLGAMQLEQPVVRATDEAPLVVSKIVESISPEMAFNRDVIRETDSMIPSRSEQRRCLGTFVKSCDQFDLFEAANYVSGDATIDDLISAESPFK